MRQVRFAGMLLVAAALGLAAAPGRAAIRFTFDHDQYLVEPGGQVSVPVYLEFTGQEMTDLEAVAGLSSAAVRLHRVDPGPGSPAFPISVAPNTLDFDDPILVPLIAGPTPQEVGLWEFADLTRASGVLGTVAEAGARRIALGDFVFQGGTVLLETTRFQAADYDPALDDTVTFTLPTTALDSLIVPATVEILVAPEPATLGLLALGTASLLLRRRRRR